MVDPTHGAGKAEYVVTMAKATISAGAVSLMTEVHPNPAQALSDGPQSLTLEGFEEFMKEMTYFAKYFGRSNHTSNGKNKFVGLFMTATTA